MDYNEGFNDAVELFEETINRALKDDYVSDEQTIDSIIATLYVAKLQASIMEDEYVACLEKQYTDDSCTCCGELLAKGLLRNRGEF